MMGPWDMEVAREKEPGEISDRLFEHLMRNRAWPARVYRVRFIITHKKSKGTDFENEGAMVMGALEERVVNIKFHKIT